MSATTLMWICMALVVVLGIPFILLWWRDMDRWADAEHRRFSQPAQRDRERPTVVLRDEPADAGPSRTIDNDAAPDVPPSRPA